MCHKYGCVFYSPTSMTCDYFLITGKTRGCAPTDECEHYGLTLNGVKPIYKGFKPRGVTQAKLDKLELAYQKYESKSNSVEELAKKAGMGKALMRGYVRKVHPESKLVKADGWDFG